MLRRETAFLVAAALLACAAGAVFYLSRATTVRVAAAPAGGTEPALLRAFGEVLKARHRDIRLEIRPYDGVRESAAALAAGEVDLAVVRPDIAVPGNGLTLAVLREQALLVVAPGTGIGSMADLAGRRLGFLAPRTADRALIADLLAHEGLRVAAEGEAGSEGLVLVGIEEGDLARALSDRRIDAMAMVTTPTTPAARRIVETVRSASPEGRLALFGVRDAAAAVLRRPVLQPVTVPAGFFGADPRLPAEDLVTVGVGLRLMARASLSRSVAASVTQHLFELRARLAEAVPAAEAMRAPAYESTADATSARLPIHPGAIDYFEREQESFVERYETWIYLVAFLGGGLGSVAAWLRQRLSRLRRERIAEATERLLEIRREAGRGAGPGCLARLADEVDDLAADIADCALYRHTEARTMSAAAIAIDAARSTLARRRADGEGEAAGGGGGDGPGPDAAGLAPTGGARR